MPPNPGPTRPNRDPPDDEPPASRPPDNGEPPGNRRPDDREPPASRRPDDDRESIWSIPARLKRLYFALFTIQTIIAIILLTLTALADQSLTGIPAKTLFVWQNTAPAAITSATVALILTDAWNLIMVLSTWLEDELKKRRQRQLDAAVKKAVAEALAQERSRWEEWVDRRDAAAAAGQEFTEPPPGRAAPDPPNPQQP